MTSPYNLPDYRGRFFEHKTLTPIHGPPTLDTILLLFKQIKRNAQKVPTTLGGGQHGYLGLLVAAIIYATIPFTVPFVRPPNPGVFSIVPNPTPPTTRTNPNPAPAPLTNEDIAMQKVNYENALRLYNECQAVEALLRTQIAETIEAEYLMPLRNNLTDMITDAIPDIFTFLIDNYGQPSPQELKQRETTLDNMVYDPSTHVNTIFLAIEDYKEICELIKQPVPDHQLVNYAYLTLQKHLAFRDSLKTWNKRTIAKTYNDFKTFIRAEYQDILKVGGLTVAAAGLSEANMAKQLQDVKDHNENVANSVKEELRQDFIAGLQAFNLQQHQENIDPNLPSPYPFTADTSPPPPFHTPNLTPYDNMFALQQPSSYQQLASQNQQMATQMAQMQAQLANLTSVNQGGNNTFQQGTQFRRERQQFGKQAESDDINPKTNQPWKRYCWTCGCCTHWSRNCPKKKRGHKDNASFRNRMGGSNVNCQ